MSDPALDTDESQPQIENEDIPTSEPASPDEEPSESENTTTFIDNENESVSDTESPTKDPQEPDQDPQEPTNSASETGKQPVNENTTTSEGNSDSTVHQNPLKIFEKPSPEAISELKNRYNALFSTFQKVTEKSFHVELNALDAHLNIVATVENKDPMYQDAEDLKEHRKTLYTQAFEVDVHTDCLPESSPTTAAIHPPADSETESSPETTDPFGPDITVEETPQKPQLAVESPDEIEATPETESVQIEPETTAEETPTPIPSFDDIDTDTGRTEPREAESEEKSTTIDPNYGILQENFQIKSRVQQLEHDNRLLSINNSRLQGQLQEESELASQLSDKLKEANSTNAELRAINYRLHSAGKVTSDQAFPHTGDSIHNYKTFLSHFCDDVLEALEDMDIKNPCLIVSVWTKLTIDAVSDFFNKTRFKFVSSLCLEDACPDPIDEIPEIKDFFYTHFRKYRSTVLSTSIISKLTEKIHHALTSNVTILHVNALKKLERQSLRLIPFIFEQLLQSEEFDHPYPSDFSPKQPHVIFDPKLHSGAVDDIEELGIKPGDRVLYVFPSLFVNGKIKVQGRVNPISGESAAAAESNDSNASPSPSPSE